jgi:putative NAD(P)-binding protein
VLDTNKLKKTMAGQDVVYVNLAGDLEAHAKSIVKAMDETGVRLLFISSMGIYDEVPNRKSARLIEESDFDYTIVRSAWFTHAEETEYETTQKGEPFKGSVLSRKSVARRPIRACRRRR